MQGVTRVCLFTTDNATGEEMRRALERAPRLLIAAEVRDWEELRHSTAYGGFDVVMVNLDGDREGLLKAVQNIGHFAPDLPVIGCSRDADVKTVISAMRAGCAQFVCCPIDDQDLRSALDRVHAAQMVHRAQSRRICVIGANGGVGATTIACNLSIELAQLTDKPAALVDLNLEFGDVAATFDAKAKYSFADLCRGAGDIDRTMIEGAAVPLPCNVSILTRPELVEDARHVDPDGVERVLSVLGTMYANVVIDLPRSFGFLSSVALNGADVVLIIAQLSVPSIRNATRIRDLLLQMGAAEGSMEVVLNRCKADYERITADDVEKHFRRPVFAAIPNDYRNVMAALDFGHPIMADSPTSPARLAIKKLAEKVAADTDPANSIAKSPPRPGLLAKLLRK